MPRAKFNNAKIKGICCAVPNNPISIEEMVKPYFDENYVKKTIDIIGVKQLYYAKEGQTTSDLGYAAAEKLIADIGWKKESIDGLIFISQTPDYILPATSCILQDRLRLPITTLTLDINLGCSAYIYGLFLANQFISAKTCKKIILIVGDTISRKVSPKDKSSVLIFGDGVSVTAVEFSDDNSLSSFILKADGSGASNLIIPAGSNRYPSTEESRVEKKDQDGNIRTDEHIYMDGMEIFSFALREVPKIIKEVIDLNDWTSIDVDKLLLHQANNYMLKHIAQKAKIPMDKLPLNMDSFGNTGGATIPFLICDKLKDDVKINKLRVVMSAFGVGLSWGGAAMELSDLFCSETLYI